MIVSRITKLKSLTNQHIRGLVQIIRDSTHNHIETYLDKAESTHTLLQITWVKH